jgi:hypothetical protein
MPQLKLRQPSRVTAGTRIDLVTRVDFGGRNHRRAFQTAVTCIWAGDAKIDVTISRNGSSDDSRVLSLTPPNNEASSGDLQIRFVGLTPIHRQADGSAPRAYVAQLVVNRI